MDSTVELWMLKGRPKENAVEHLMGYKKARLFQLAETHQITDLKKNDTKVTILDILVPAIKKHYAIDVAQMNAAEKEQLAQIKDNNTDVVELQQVQNLVEKGYLFVYLYKGQIQVVIPKEWEENLEQSEKEATTLSSARKFAPFFEHATTVKQIFGSINVEHLVTVWNRYYDDSLNTETAIQLLQEHNLSRQ